MKRSSRGAWRARGGGCASRPHRPIAAVSKEELGAEASKTLRLSSDGARAPHHDHNTRVARADVKDGDDRAAAVGAPADDKRVETACKHIKSVNHKAVMRGALLVPSEWHCQMCLTGAG